MQRQRPAGAAACGMSTDPGLWDSASMVSTSATSPRSASSGVKWVRQRVVVVNVDGEEPPHDAAAQTFEADTSDAPSHVTKLTMERNELSLKNEALQQQLAHVSVRIRAPRRAARVPSNAPPFARVAGSRVRPSDRGTRCAQPQERHARGAARTSERRPSRRESE